MKQQLVIAALACLLLGGCASGGSTESLENIQQQLLGDMPLPQGSKISNEQSLILGWRATMDRANCDCVAAGADRYLYLLP